MNAKELRDQSIDDLTKRGKELREELFNLRLQSISGSLENSAKIKQTRRAIARVETVTAQKKRAEAQK